MADPATADVIAALRSAAQTVATAESLTAGGVCVELTTVPGASDVVRGGLVVYAAELKNTLAGVDAQLLRACGTVHVDVAVALASGARQRCGADWGIGLTGVAGPGAAEGHPAGTVHVAVTGPRVSDGRSLRLPGDRAAVRSATVAHAVALLGEHLGATGR